MLKLLKLILPSKIIIFNLLFVWIFFGASLWITIIPFTYYSPPYSFILGIYCIAYIAGFFVPFAPAGLGIREPVLVLGLTLFVNIDIAILLAGINRIVYFGVEVLLGLSTVIKNK